MFVSMCVRMRIWYIEKEIERTERKEDIIKEADEMCESKRKKELKIVARWWAG